MCMQNIAALGACARKHVHVHILRLKDFSYISLLLVREK